MLLQVHDELIFETSEHNIEKIKTIIVDVMMKRKAINKSRYTACCFCR